MGADAGSELSLALLTTIREAVAPRTGSAPSLQVCPPPPSYTRLAVALCLVAVAQLWKPFWCSQEVYMLAGLL